MDAENFGKWTASRLLPNVPRNSFIILDNAPYHNAFTKETFPQSTATKAELQQWLREHKIPFGNWLLKPALHDICCRNAPPPEYSIDRLASEYGCKILRTPQYHPELQPIEHVRGIIKSDIAETQAGDYTMKSLKERLVQSLKKNNTCNL